MFSLRNRFGIPGVISVIALVFAMLGGAYAASNSSSGGKATASKAKRGPRGPKGATGPTGPAGANGSNGTNGKDGANGSNGATGATGATGKSVTTAIELPGVHCPEGGASVEVEGTPASKKYACNGEEGEEGEKGEKGERGDPWTPNNTLPKGATETGAWAFNGLTSNSPEKYGAAQVWVPISFPIKLASALDGNGCTIKEGAIKGPCQVHFINENGKENFLNLDTFETEELTPPSCHGSAVAPSADPGNLCVYTGRLLAAFPGVPILHVNAIEPVDGRFGAGPGASTAGAKLVFSDPAAAPSGEGTWAVTG